jgi:hypothetical protein
MKKLLYVGHAYHKKTKSVGFLQDLLEGEYEVHYFADDPRSPAGVSALESLPVKEFDVLVVFQIMPSISEIRRFVSFKKGVFFPMYDFYYACTPLCDPIWNEYKDFTIINFSKKLHQDLEENGFDSKYIQYFPKPFKNFDWGKAGALYFWQRVTHINVYLIYDLLHSYPLTHLHFHKVLDPTEEYVPISDDPSNPCGVFFKSKEVTYSEWYPTREDMYHDIEKCALYMAPRYHEGIGMSFLEAMAMGRCVIAVDHPTMNEYITHGKTGFLYSLEGRSLCDISPEEVRQVQKNTYEYMQEGYKRWENSKHLILEWLECARICSESAPSEGVSENTVHVHKGFFRKIYDWFKGAGVDWEVKQCNLFGLVPLFEIRKARKGNRLRVSIFRIPVYECKVNDMRASWGVKK